MVPAHFTYDALQGSDHRGRQETDASAHATGRIGHKTASGASPEVLANGRGATPRSPTPTWPVGLSGGPDQLDLDVRIRLAWSCRLSSSGMSLARDSDPATVRDGPAGICVT
jgi:hypothetical protein